MATIETDSIDPTSELTHRSTVNPYSLYQEAVMNRNHQLIHFLQHELAVSSEEIAVLLNHPEQDYAPLPMLLWQYGLVSLQQLTQIFDWLENRMDEAIVDV